MVPDRQKVWTDRRNGLMDRRTHGRTDDAKTLSRRLRPGITTEIYYVSFFHKRLEKKVRNLILMKYDYQTDL